VKISVLLIEILIVHELLQLYILEIWIFFLMLVGIFNDKLLFYSVVSIIGPDGFLVK